MKLYFLGIGGTAMGNLAILMKSLGHDVCGSDGKLYPPMSDLLADAHIKLFEGYSVQQLQQFAPDLVVVGNVIPRGNPEIEWLLNTRAFPYCSLPELIRQQMIGSRDAIVVTGTHGKTTTTALVTYFLQNNHQNPGYFIGGSPKNFPTGAAYGDVNAPVVLEGDEYDSAFFDKRSKFIHYAPKFLIINNIELDHVDIFRDLEDVKRTFRHLIKLVPSNGCIFANGDSSVIRELLPVPWTQTYFVGENADNDFRITDTYLNEQGTRFNVSGTFRDSFSETRNSDVNADENPITQNSEADFSPNNSKRETIQMSLTSPLFGQHNVRNVAMAALATRRYLEHDFNTDLSGFKGVRKRQEVLFNNGTTVIIEDFAHHPTAIFETIRAIRQKFPEHRIITAFEPRSNTTCTNRFQTEFIDAFTGSDEVYISEVFRKRGHCLDIDQLVRAITYCPAHTTSPEHIKATFPQKINATKQVFLFLSNGNFGGIAKFLCSLMNSPDW